MLGSTTATDTNVIYNFFVDDLKRYAKTINNVPSPPKSNKKKKQEWLCG